MIYEDSKIWLTVAALTSAGISQAYIYKKVSESRKHGRTTWKARKSTGGVQIDYDSLPEATKEKLPARADLVRMAQAGMTEEQLELFQKAVETLTQLHTRFSLVSDYNFFLHRITDPMKAEDLKQAAGWLRLLNAYKIPKETRTIGFETKAAMRTAVVEQILADVKQNKRHLYGFKVTNVAVLQRKELAWGKAFQEAFERYSTEPKLERERLSNEAALGTLIHDNFGNSHRRVLGKLNPNEHERILLPSGRIDFSEWNARTLVYLFMNPGRANKYDFENLYRRYLYECKKEGRKPAVNISAVKDFLTCNEVKLYTERERHGWAQLDKLLPHVYGAGYQLSLTKGGYDGFQVDFTSRLDGKQLMLTVVAVFDYKSGAITGFDVGLVEDGHMVRKMWRNHLNVMGGRGYIEIESDRFSGNLAADTVSIFERTCQYISQPTPNDPQGKAPNPKARYVERLIQELNRIAQNMDGWKGTNITSIDHNRKPNPDYRNGNYVEGYAESVNQIIRLINIYNHDTYNRTQSRWDECLQHINPNAPAIPREQIAMLLNKSTKATVRGGKISIEVNRRTHEYGFPEFDQVAYMMEKGFRVTVYYDEDDMSSIDVFGVNDQYIATLGRLKRVARAKAEQTREDLQLLGDMVGKRKAMINRIEVVTRKVLEAEAAELGIDISNMSIKEAQEVIAGCKHITEEELFAETLQTPEALAAKAYYDDRLIRSAGEDVPLTKAEQKSLIERQRELTREKFKRNKDTF